MNNELLKIRQSLNETTMRHILAMQVRTMREAKGWSTADLSIEAGIPEKDIVKIESLGSHVSIASLKAVAKAFDVALFVRFTPYGYSPEQIKPQSFTEENGGGVE